MNGNLHNIYKKYIEPNFQITERWDEDDFCNYIMNHQDIYHVVISDDGNCCLVWCELPEKVIFIVYFVSLEKGKGYGSRFISEWLKNNGSGWRYVLEASEERQIHFWSKCGFSILNYDYSQAITMGGNDIPAKLMTAGCFEDNYLFETNIRKCVYGLKT